MTRPSPFPGMDPYLERCWSGVHTRMIVYIGDQLDKLLPPDLQARVEESMAGEAEDYRRTIYPDAVAVGTSKVREPDGDAAGVAAVAEPLTIELPLAHASQRPKRKSIRIEDREGRRVITAIELLSPANKTTDAGRLDYLKKQRDYFDGEVNLVEIDLIRQGESVLAVPPDLVPPDRRTPYAACVWRATEPHRAKYYPIPLQSPLPAIHVPLRPGDADIVLELQPLLEQCYRRGRYDSIDYSRPLELPFSDADRRWIEQAARHSEVRAS